MVLSIFIGFGSIFLDSCKKNEVPLLTDNSDVTDEENYFLRGSATDRENDEFTKMVLGREKNNPFDYGNMSQAWVNLYGEPASPLPVTHLYVRFKPANLDELKLFDALDVELIPFPLLYEIEEEGDYYHEGELGGDEIPWMYAVVPPEFAFPAVQYEILSEIINAPYDSDLTREAFRLLGEPYDTGADDRSGCEVGCPNYPDCLQDPNLGCGNSTPPTGSGPTGTGTPPCTPDSPDWPDCLMTPGIDGYDPAVHHEVNSCGCQVSTEQRRPGGCVHVVDTQLPANTTLPDGTSVHLDGVKQAKIRWWNGWFGIWTTYTDNNGCWQINRSDRHRGYMWVKFKNSRNTIRGLRGARIWEYALAVTDKIGVVGGPNFNDISVIYPPTGGDGSKSRLYWYAATANNALWDYKNFALANDIVPPHGKLDVLLHNANTAASAPMFDKANLKPDLFGLGVVASFLLGYIPVAGPVLSPVVLLLSSFIATFAPDIYYGYGTEAMVSDRVKETFYHEFGHASHFAATGSDSDYWKDNITYIVGNAVSNNNPPYGVRGAGGSQRAAIIEMWGFHIGPHIADDKYGLFHSRTLSTIPAIIERTRWFYVNEGFVPDVAGSIGADDWIPGGLFHDLFDNNALNPVGINEPPFIATFETISGFTHANFLSAVSIGSPTALTQVETNLAGTSPPGVTPTMLRAYFAAYGY